MKISCDLPLFSLIDFAQYIIESLLRSASDSSRSVFADLVDFGGVLWNCHSGHGVIKCESSVHGRSTPLLT